MRSRLRNIFVVVSFVSICFASDNILLSHRSIVRKITQSAVKIAVEESKVLASTAVSFFMDSTVVNNLLRYNVVEALTAQNRDVYTALASADTQFSCTANELTLSYGEVFTESLFGSRKVERTISVTMNFTITSQSQQKILYTKNITMANIDTVLYSDIEALQDLSLPLKTVSQPQLSFFDSILEPAIVTVASAVAIYLFFTIRS